MKLKDKSKWDKYVSLNKDSYGKACVNVAEEVMKLLDKDSTPLHSGYYPNIHTAHGLICKADDNIKAGGITGFMAGCVAQMVYECHERGDEFRKSHNGDDDIDGVINPAILTIKDKQ